MTIAEKVKNLGLELPPSPDPLGTYRPVVESGKLAFLSGQIAKKPDGTILTGKLGGGLSLEEGKKAAQMAALNVLSIIHHIIREDRLVKLLKVTGYVQTDPNFSQISQVVNGASDLLIQVLGEKGYHARTAVGMASLPFHSAVEIEVLLEVK